MSSRKDHPTFMLQFDHDSSQEDQSTHVTSHEQMSAKGQNKHDAQYSSLKSSETKYMNDVCTSSQVNDKAVSQTGRDSEQTCNVDEMICHISIPHSELTKYANYSEMLREQGQESKMVLLQYSQVFGDSEAYEQHASQAITDLTAHAQLLLETLNDQKKILCNRINNISDALKHEC